MNKGMGVGVGIGLGIVGVVLLVVALLQHARVIQVHVGHLAVYVAVLGVAAVAAGAWLALPSLRKTAG